MKIMIKYCGYCRKDGSYNMVTFDPEAKVYTNKAWPSKKWNDPSDWPTFVEASKSSDVDDLRRKLIRYGYKEVD